MNNDFWEVSSEVMTMTMIFIVDAVMIYWWCYDMLLCGIDISLHINPLIIRNGWDQVIT